MIRLPTTQAQSRMWLRPIPMKGLGFNRTILHNETSNQLSQNRGRPPTQTTGNMGRTISSDIRKTPSRLKKENMYNIKHESTPIKNSKPEPSFYIKN